jgi:hypothetical protein
MLKGRVDDKGKKKGKGQSLLGGKGDEVVDDQQIEDEEDKGSFIEDGLFSIGERGVSITREDVQSLTLTPTPIRKPVVRCKFHDGIVTNKVCRIPLSPNSQPSAFYSTIYPPDEAPPLILRSSRYGHAAINMYPQTPAKQPSSTSHAPTHSASTKAAGNSTPLLVHIPLTKSDPQSPSTVKWEPLNQETQNLSA